MLTVLTRYFKIRNTATITVYPFFLYTQRVLQKSYKQKFTSLEENILDPKVHYCGFTTNTNPIFIIL